MGKIDMLEFECSTKEPGFQLAYMPARRCTPPFSLEVQGPGFSAGRDFTRDELLSIRDWIDAALAATAPAREAEE